MKLNFFLGLLLCSQLSWGAEVRRSLNISSLPPEIQTELTQRFPQIIGNKVTLDMVDEVIRFLQVRPDFDLVQVVSSGNNQLKVVIDRSTRISDIKFEGLRAISESEAKLLFGVNVNDILNQDQLINGGEKIRLQYNQIGYRNTSIDVEVPPDDKGNVILLVKVKEGLQTKIGGFTINSVNTDLNKSLQSRISREKGYPLTDSRLAEIQKTIRDYLNSRFYVRTEVIGPEISLSADESQALLSFRLEKVDSYSINFVGNREVLTSTLNDSLDLGNFYSANPNISSELSSKLKNLYLSRGFARIEIQAEETEGRKPFTRRLTFNIEEGPRIKISKYEISGTLSRPPEYYAKLLKKHSSDLIQDGYYNKTELDQGFEALRVALQNEGYLLSKINSTRVQYNKEKNQVAVYISLDEGPLTQIETIRFIGNDTLTREELLEVLELENNSALRLTELETAIQNLKLHYQEKGYIDMVLLNEKEDLVTYNDTNTQATLNFKIYEGPQVRIATIVLDGNTFTKDYVLLNEIDLQPGDTLSPSKLDEAVSKLQRTGYFNTVEVRTLEEKTSVANRTLVIKVTERDPGLFTLGAGVTNELGVTLRGYTGIAYNNIKGTGRGVSLRLEGNYNVSEIKYLESKTTLGYVEPYLFDSKFRGRVNLSRSSQITDRNHPYKVSDVFQTVYSLERDITSHLTFIWDIWNSAHYKDSFLFSDVSPEAQDIVTLGPRFDIDFRDNPFNPTRGNFTTISAEYSTPEIGSSRTPNEIRFFRSMASYTQYLRLPYFRNDYMVWANAFRGGYLENLSRDGGVPYDKKGFFLGGRSTIRGFEGSRDYFPSTDQLGLPDNTSTYYLRGISTMYLVKSEIRFPIYGNLGGAVFYDGGAVSIQNLNMGDEYRDAAGFGFHYHTPVGPLNLEIAWKLDQKPGESPYAFHLSIGSF